MRYYKSIVAGLLTLSIPVMLGGCEERLETPTKGFVTVVVSESVAPLIDAQKQVFEEQYPRAKVELEYATAREAISRLFNDTLKMIVSSRPLNAEERAFAEQARIDLGEYRIAVDAVAVIVNPENRVTELRTTQLDSILTGDITRWDQVGGKRAASVELYLPSRNAGTYEVLASRLPNRDNFSPPTATVGSSPEMVQYISERPNAIGILGLAWLARDSAKVKAVKLSNPNAPDTLGIADKAFSPHQAYVFQRHYPLSHDVYIYSRADRYGVAAGFISFITSASGQKIVLGKGLVPATMPVRLVELRSRPTTG